VGFRSANRVGGINTRRGVDDARRSSRKRGVAREIAAQLVGARREPVCSRAPLVPATRAKGNGAMCRRAHAWHRGISVQRRLRVCKRVHDIRTPCVRDCQTNGVARMHQWSSRDPFFIASTFYRKCVRRHNVQPQNTHSVVIVAAPRATCRY
jgi:hypothetical protein